MCMMPWELCRKGCPSEEAGIFLWELLQGVQASVLPQFSDFTGKPILLFFSVLEFMLVQKPVLSLRSGLKLTGYCITSQKQTENLTDLTPLKLFKENVTQIIPDFLRISRE